MTKRGKTYDVAIEVEGATGTYRGAFKRNIPALKVTDEVNRQKEWARGMGLLKDGDTVTRIVR
jgi:hypothetical protein